MTDDSARALLRHTVATLSYRAAKTLENAPPSFADFVAGPGSRTPVQILAHMGDLFDWALALAQGRWVWRDATPQLWNAEVARFFQALRTFDGALASNNPLGHSAEILFQGPIADALTHTGQLAYLRRLSGSPVRGESYARATIVAGHIAETYDTPRVEFD